MSQSNRSRRQFTTEQTVALLRRPELFVGTLAEKLLTYSLGRGVEYYDAPTTRAIVRESRPQNFRMSSIVLGVVKSQPFQMRKSR